MMKRPSLGMIGALALSACSLVDAAPLIRQANETMGGASDLEADFIVIGGK
jgi:hypothetical protein